MHTHMYVFQLVFGTAIPDKTGSAGFCFCHISLRIVFIPVQTRDCILRAERVQNVGAVYAKGHQFNTCLITGIS